MTEKNPGDGNAKSKYFIIAALMIVVFLLSLNPAADQHPHQFLRVNSPEKNLIAKVYVTTVDKMEGYFLSVSVFNAKEILLRKDFYRQWNCGNVAITWKNEDELTINGVSMSWEFDTIEFVVGKGELCPVRSIVY